MGFYPFFREMGVFHQLGSFVALGGGDLMECFFLQQCRNVVRCSGHHDAAHVAGGLAALAPRAPLPRLTFSRSSFFSSESGERFVSDVPQQVVAVFIFKL